MVLVPAGPFLAGEDEGQEVEAPRREVEVSSFWVEVFPVTNRQYAEFVRVTGRPPPQHWAGRGVPESLEHHPVVWITWQDAADYAAWRGKRLLTPHEWQKAARGTDGRSFPWGSEPVTDRLNCEESGLGKTTQVRQYPDGRSPYGLADMAGNVAEWVDGKLEDARGKVARIVCGGSFKDAMELSMCAVRRGFPYWWKAAHVGFRCALSK